MSLYNFHRVLIAAAILFDFLFTFWAIREYRFADEGKTALLLTAIGSSIFTIALIAYLVYFNRNLAVFRHELAERQRLAGNNADQL